MFDLIITILVLTGIVTWLTMLAVLIYIWMDS